jgi:exopolysaccharide production protein ExoQ
MTAEHERHPFWLHPKKPRVHDFAAGPEMMRTTFETRGRLSPLLSLAGTVGFVFAFRVCLTFLWFQAHPVEGSAVTVGLSLALLLITISFWLISPPPRKQYSFNPVVLKLIGVYLALSAISLSWTTTQSVTAAAGYWIAMAADVGTVLLLLRYPPAELQSARIMKGFVIGAAATAAVAWCIPAMDDLRLGDEDFLHPNAIGFELALAALFAIYLARDSKIWRWVGGGIAVTLLRTLSKASIIAFVSAALFYLLRGARISHKAKVKIGTGATLAIVYFWTVLEAYADLYSQGSNPETLTGRTIIWATAWDIAWEKPWLGHGFYSFRWVVPLFNDFEAWQAHNEFLQQFFAYGVCGVIVVALLYWTLYRQIRASAGSGLKTLASALLIFALVRGLVDTERFDLSYPLWLMALMSVSLWSIEVQPTT